MRAPGLAGLGVEIPLLGVALDKSQDLTIRSWDVPLGLEAFAAFALLGLGVSAIMHHLRSGRTRHAYHDRE